MKLETIKAELYEIAKVYPTLLGLMKKQVSQNCDATNERITVGQHWATLMTGRHSGKPQRWPSSGSPARIPRGGSGFEARRR